jgi:hypothetical protein
MLLLMEVYENQNENQNVSDGQRSPNFNECWADVLMEVGAEFSAMADELSQHAALGSASKCELLKENETIGGGNSGGNTDVGGGGDGSNVLLPSTEVESKRRKVGRESSLHSKRRLLL